MTTDVACKSCGTELRHSAKFCDECGAPTAPATDTAEYKQVTVLFADVVRSMHIAAALDLERLREIMTDLVERAAAAVQRYGGGVVEYTGDGVMAIFGAPIALEDHAFRACLAALAIQEQAQRLADEVRSHDGVELRLRVGLNSGQVIAGDAGPASLGYTATGEHVGMAQRMESVAPPGGVMVSESTARLVEHLAVLAEPEWVHIKGADEPVRARQLLSISPRNDVIRRPEASLIGRGWEMAALEAMVNRAIGGRGSVVSVVGPPGIGKSRVAREVAAQAAAFGLEVLWAFCESHTSEISFSVVARLLRAGTGVADLDDDAARNRAHTQFAGADPQDLLLLDDLLGIADPDAPLPAIDPDARRRRLTALINTASLARTEPTLLILEDVHWIDEVSESMIAELLAVIPRTPSVVLLTARPEYAGALMHVHGAQTIALASLDYSDTATLLNELLGPDPTVADLVPIIAERATGNPFFAEEMVRELAQRGALTGELGDYACRTDVAEVAVPATVQAAIEARIDRLTAKAKETLHAASVIGARFDADLLTALDIDPVLDELLSVQLIDQVRFTPSAEYAFRHPLIHAVAYESQLKTDRVQWHRRLAAAIESCSPEATEQNAALIAEHLEAAGELVAAYGWHMRAAAWSANRDIHAARVSWERARRIADRLPDVEPEKLSKRIAPTTMLCATDWQARAVQECQGRFAQLREMCSGAGDKVSLAIGMTGLSTESVYSGRLREGSRLASEQMALLESIGDPDLTIGLSVMALTVWGVAGEYDEVLRWSETVIDLAAGGSVKGATFGFGSPLAGALAWRAAARWWLGLPGWREDHRDAVATARNSDPTTLACVVAWTYGLEIQHGVLRSEDAALQASNEAMRAAEGTSNDVALSMAKYTLGVALLTRDTAADHHRGLERMVQTRDMWRQSVPFLVPVTELWSALEMARYSELDAAIAAMRQAVNELLPSGSSYGVWSTRVLVETLLERGAEGDSAEAEKATERMAELWSDRGSAMVEITLVRLRTLLARARGDDGYRELLSRYRTMAKSLGFEGHIAMAEAM
ncbi:cyclase [Mycobacterium sp. GA-1199]|uniref:AAA family ATPase n=1 Tax=Mycobacterium sp. GA-1199 TaxID=1772287 RepID=UPI000747AB63|nr:adenylate/guanylate cyclase domain-containing protein [Mycobacterium sp. GA-1199]KUI46632.1 cyclase [Mycobacterium sp. GA-1199]